MAKFPECRYCNEAIWEAGANLPTGKQWYHCRNFETQCSGTKEPRYATPFPTHADALFQKVLRAVA